MLHTKNGLKRYLSDGWRMAWAVDTARIHMVPQGTGPRANLL